MARSKKVDKAVDDAVQKAPRAPRGKQPRRDSAADGPQHTGTAAPPAEPLTHAAISRRAYERWETRGRAEGSPEDDWFEAERELRRERS